MVVTGPKGEVEALVDCKVAIGIATLNGAERIDKLLASIKQHTADAHDYKIIVIDDGSTERVLQQLRPLCVAYGVELQEHRTNQGISATWNHLCARFDCKYVVLLNDDVVVSPRWLDALVFFADSNKFGMAALHPLRNGKIVKCGGGEIELFSEEASIPHRVVAANGYCFIIEKAKWTILGGFDEQFISFYEEVDFGVRCLKMGFSSFNIPWPMVDHEWSTTFQQNDRLLLPAVRMQHSREYFIKKWGADLPELIPSLKNLLPPPQHVTWLTEGGPVTGSVVLEVNR